MKSVPLVSVLVPVYNGARYLELALRSAQRQTYRNLEVLIRDDGSGDASREIAESFCTRDRRFRLVPSDGSRLGGTGNMVELLGLASGEFVKYLHQDDILEPACIERLAHPLRFDRSVTMATSVRNRIDADGQELAITHAAYRPLRERNAKLHGADLVREMVVTRLNQLGEPSVALFRNGVVDPQRAFVLDGVSYSYLNDVALWTNLLLRGDLAWRVEALSSFRTHAGQRSGQLHEEITVVGEWASFSCFGVEHGFLAEEADFLRIARQLTEALSRLDGQVPLAPVSQRADLAAGLADAVANVRALLAVGPAKLVGTAS